MGPSRLQHGFILLRVKSVTVRVDLWRHGTEQVARKHGDDFGVDRFGDNASIRVDILHELVEGLALDLLALEVRQHVVEVEQNGRLLKFLDEEVLPLSRWHLAEAGQLDQLDFFCNVEA
eukprot:Lithocolla_globosa_v1_NODE_2556_length_1955_cov_492.368947.p3 type:complete len:119 gc:universal NODE_2556_length_1955_cov_492.368947:1255-1611(+)